GRAEALYGLPEVLVASRMLINDRTIRQVSVGGVRYYHILFDSHELIEQAELTSVAGFAELCNGALRLDFDGGRSGLRNPSVAVAEARLAEGATLFASDLRGELLTTWCRQLDSALGLMPDTARINGFMANAGEGLDWHWDAHELFVVQIYGHKRWQVAPNHCVPNPTCNGGPTYPVRPELRHQMESGSKIEAPEDIQELETGPGSVIFLPRGYFHRVDNLEPSAHLVIPTPLINWRDAFTFFFAELPELFSPEWRRPSTNLHPGKLFTDGLDEFRDRIRALEELATEDGLRRILSVLGRR
ncbi:MAG: cupin domain-containing protein, partial [Pseudomonadota bacterium]